MESIPDIAIHNLPYYEIKDNTAQELCQAIFKHIEQSGEKNNFGNINYIHILTKPNFNDGTCVAFLAFANLNLHREFVTRYNNRIVCQGNILNIELSRNKPNRKRDVEQSIERSKIESYKESPNEQNSTLELDTHTTIAMIGHPSITQEQDANDKTNEQSKLINETELTEQNPTIMSSRNVHFNSPIEQIKIIGDRVDNILIEDTLPFIPKAQICEGEEERLSKNNRKLSITLKDELAKYTPLSPDKIHGPCVSLDEYNRIETTLNGIIRFIQLDDENTKRGEQIIRMERRNESLTTKYNELKRELKTQTTQNANLEQALSEYVNNEQELNKKILNLQVENEELHERLSVIERAVTKTKK